MFSTNTALDRHLVVIGEIDRELHVGKGELPERVVDGVPLHRRVHRSGAVLERDDVLRTTGNHASAGHAEHSKGDLVRHRARGHEHRRLLADPLGKRLLEEVHRRVFSGAVVADLGLGHGAAHRRGGLRDGVRPQIDDAVALGHASKLRGLR